MDNPATKLDACPFCGGEAMEAHTSEPSVQCMRCPVGMVGDTEAEAIAAWNTRALVPRADLAEGVEWQAIETAEMWQVAIVTDGHSATISQKAEAALGGHYWAVDPEDCLEWEPTHWTPVPAFLARHEASDGGGDAE